MSTSIRVAIVISHPVQHFCPQYVSYANCTKWHTKVFFASTLGVDHYEDKDFQQSIRWNNLSLDKFDHIFLNKHQNLPISPSLDAPELDSALSDYNPDVVIVSGYIQKFQRRAYSWAQTHGKLLFYGSDSERMQHRPWWKEAIKYPFLRNYLSKISRVLTVGNANEFYYQHYGVSLKKMTRVGFPIDVELYQTASESYPKLRTRVRQRLDVKDHTIVLAVVGKFIPKKRQIDLIDALNLLEQTSSLQFHLLLIGSGEQQHQLEQAAQLLKHNKVHFTGFIPPEQLPELYAATDIYIHPSAIEPHSLAISEAIFMGCPIIVSNRCGSYGPHDDVQVGVNGLVYSCGDIAQLAACIQSLGENPKLRSFFSEHSKGYAQMSQQRAHGLGLAAALRAEGFNLEV